MEEFEIENAFGQRVTLNCLSLIKDEDHNQDYIIYTDNTTDEEGELRIYVSEIIKTEEKVTLEEVEDYEKIDLISKEMDKLFRQNSK